MFGEVLEHQLHTPNVSASELQSKLLARADVLVLDTRPRAEFEDEHIPGAIRCAGSELAYRAAGLANSPDTQLVVNCGGRTRAILGAQGLINLGSRNPVAALTGGTMEWLLAGFTLEAGPGRTAPLPTAEAAEEARRRAVDLADSNGIRRINLEMLQGFAKDTERTLYRFDVRSPRGVPGRAPAGIPFHTRRRAVQQGCQIHRHLGRTGCRVLIPRVCAISLRQAGSFNRVGTMSTCCAPSWRVPWKSVPSDRRFYVTPVPWLPGSTSPDCNGSRTKDLLPCWISTSAPHTASGTLRAQCIARGGGLPIESPGTVGR